MQAEISLSFLDNVVGDKAQGGKQTPPPSKQKNDQNKQKPNQQTQHNNKPENISCQKLHV